jgi:uncharacterized protein YyaL (SSP411 family)
MDDDGDYFTWTLEEARTVLDPAEAALATRYWAIREVGDMRHNPARNVLPNCGSCSMGRGANC